MCGLLVGACVPAEESEQVDHHKERRFSVSDTMLIEPSDAERATWPQATSEYVSDIERELASDVARAERAEAERDAAIERANVAEAECAKFRAHVETLTAEHNAQAPNLEAWASEIAKLPEMQKERDELRQELNRTNDLALEIMRERDEARHSCAEFKYRVQRGRERLFSAVERSKKIRQERDAALDALDRSQLLEGECAAELDCARHDLDAARAALHAITDMLRGHQHVDTNKCTFCSILRIAAEGVE